MIGSNDEICGPKAITVAVKIASLLKLQFDVVILTFYQSLQYVCLFVCSLANVHIIRVTVVDFFIFITLKMLIVSFTYKSKANAAVFVESIACEILFPYTFAVYFWVQLKHLIWNAANTVIKSIKKIYQLIFVKSFMVVRSSEELHATFTMLAWTLQLLQAVTIFLIQTQRTTQRLIG